MEPVPRTARVTVLNNEAVPLEQVGLDPVGRKRDSKTGRLPEVVGYEIGPCSFVGNDTITYYDTGEMGETEEGEENAWALYWRVGTMEYHLAEHAEDFPLNDAGLEAAIGKARIAFEEAFIEPPYVS